jgi:signal transduction histidine kinase
MNRLVEQLLRVARLDAVVLDVTGTVDLNDVARGVVAAMAPWALTRERMIAFRGSNSPVYVEGNGHAVADAIRNLIENAVVYSPPQTEVLVRTNADRCVSVADRGPGIPAVDREHIFDRFWRGRSAQSEGVGLGLAIVKEIMKAHRGTISIAEGPLGGAIFSLSFPVPNCTNQELSPGAARSAASSSA